MKKETIFFTGSQARTNSFPPGLPPLQSTSWTSLECSTHLQRATLTSHLYPWHSLTFPPHFRVISCKVTKTLLFKAQILPCYSWFNSVQMHPVAHEGLPASASTLLSLSNSTWDTGKVLIPPRTSMRQLFPSPPQLPNCSWAMFSSLVPGSQICWYLRSSLNFPRLSEVFPLPFFCTTCPSSQVALTILHSPQFLTKDFKIQKSLENRNFSHNPSGSEIWPELIKTIHSLSLYYLLWMFKISHFFAEEILILLKKHEYVWLWGAAQTLLVVLRRVGLGWPYIHPTFKIKNGQWPGTTPGQV